MSDSDPNPSHYRIIELCAELIESTYDVMTVDETLESSATTLTTIQTMLTTADELRSAVREFATFRLGTSMRPITSTIEELSIEADNSDHMEPRLLKP